MLKYDLSKILEKKPFFSFYKVGGWNIYVEKMYCTICVLKNTNILQKNIGTQTEPWLIAHPNNHCWQEQ
jgi:hypothetical protein